MSIEITRRHALGESEIKARVDKIVREMAESIQLKYTWDGNIVTFSRTGLDGRLEYSADEVKIFINPSVWLPVSRRRIREEVNAHLDQNLNGVEKEGG